MVKRFALLGAGLALALSTSASAGGIATTPPSFSINGEAVTNESLNCRDGDNLIICDGGQLTPEGKEFSLLEWQFGLDPDPSVVLFFAIQNNAAVAQSFVFDALLPVVPTGPQVIAFGSVGGSLTDANGDGASLTDSGAPLYISILDGALVATLLDPPQTASAGAFESATVGPASFGPTLIADSADIMIGVRIQFTLSPGDIASFTSVFNVEPIPEPGTLVLVGSGIAGLVTYGRRRTA